MWMFWGSISILLFIACSFLFITRQYRIAVIASIFIIIFSLIFYLWRGNYLAVKGRFEQQAQQRQTQKLMKELNRPELIIERLKQRLKQEPQSAQGWYLLGRMYITTRQIKLAVDAFAHAYELAPDNLQMILSYMDSLLELNQGHVNSLINNLNQQALNIAPQDPIVLNMAAIVAYQQDNYQLAIQYWEKLLAEHSPSPQEQQLYMQAIAKARKKMQQMEKNKK